MADVTYYVALPFPGRQRLALRRGRRKNCQSSSGALRRAEWLSRAAGSSAQSPSAAPAIPMIGEFGDAQ